MLWKKDKKRMEFIQTFIPTSKAQLIQAAMWYHKGDIEKAQQMVDFYTKNMPHLPDFDPVQPTFMQQLKSSTSDLFTWVKENQGDIVQCYQMIYSIIKNKGALPIVGSPLPDEGSPLPPINE